jgi:hypothetical protein
MGAEASARARVLLLVAWGGESEHAYFYSLWPQTVRGSACTDTVL